MKLEIQQGVAYTLHNSMKLSVVLAVRNEEANLGRCLESVKKIADEIVVVDEHSIDSSVKIAKNYGARVYEEPHHEIFHVTKQVAMEKAKGEWILQLDADEIVTSELADEIKKVINTNELDLDGYLEEMKKKYPKKWRLFARHQRAVEERDGVIGRDGEIVAFFIPRVNLFLGKPLIHAGVYPDAVIRLVKNGYAKLPAKSVHEQMEIEGRVGWLFNDMLHNDSPTLTKYIMRLNRYTDLHAQELKEKHAPKNIFYFYYYSIFKAKVKFLSLFVRHRGYKDGMRGFLWSAFSAWHYPIAYFKYFTGV